MCFAIVVKDSLALFEPCTGCLDNSSTTKTSTVVKFGNKAVGFQAQLKKANYSSEAQMQLLDAIKKEVNAISTEEYWVRIDCEKGVIGTPDSKPVWRKEKNNEMLEAKLFSAVDMTKTHSPKSFSSRIQAAFDPNKDMNTKHQQPTSTPKTVKGMTATRCTSEHPCCMMAYLNRPLPLRPPEKKRHVDNLISRAQNIASWLPPSEADMLNALQLLEQAVTYADDHRLFSHAAKAQLYRGHVFLNLGYPSEASWCATRAFGWVERKTGVEGRGQREAAKLKTKAEEALAALTAHDPRRFLSDDSQTIPGRLSGGLGSAKRERGGQHERREQRERREISKWSHTTKSAKSQSARLSLRGGVRLVDQESPTSLRYIGPPRIGIVHDEEGELWKVAGSRSSVLLGNKDETRQLQVVNPVHDRWLIEEEIEKQISEITQDHRVDETSSERRGANFSSFRSQSRWS